MDDGGAKRADPMTLQNLDYGGLDNATGFLLRLAQLRVFDYFYQVLGPHDLRLGTISALILIRHNPGIRHGVLAEALSIRLAHTTKMLKSLEAGGLVERTQSTHDRRSVELRLTVSGEALAARMQGLIGLHDGPSVGCLTERERRQLKRLLRKCAGIPAHSPNLPATPRPVPATMSAPGQDLGTSSRSARRG